MSNIARAIGRIITGLIIVFTVLGFIILAMRANGV